MKKTVPAQNPKSVFEIENPDRDFRPVRDQSKMQPERLEPKQEFKEENAEIKIYPKQEFKEQKQDFKEQKQEFKEQK